MTSTAPIPPPTVKPLRAASSALASPQGPPVTPEIRLKRFLYVSDERLVFTSGVPELHGNFKRENLRCIADMFDSDNPEKFFNIIEIANGHRDLPYRTNLFYALALAVTTPNATNQLRHRVYETVLQIAGDDDDLFAFIKYMTRERKSVTRAMARLICNYYKRKDPVDILRDVLTTNRRHGWLHKDVIKLSHMKTAPENKLMNSVITFILFNHVEAAAIVKEDESDTAKQMIELMQNGVALRKSKEENQALDLIPKLPTFTHEQIHLSLHKSEKIWLAIVDRLSIQNLLTNLLNLYKMGLLQKDSALLKKVNQIVGDSTKIKQSKIQPATVFITLRNFEKGGRPIDGKLLNHLHEKAVKKLLKADALEAATSADKKVNTETLPLPDFKNEPSKCPSLVNMLNRKTMQHSFANVQSFGKHYYVSIEVTDAMLESTCITSKNVLCLEAAVMIALTIYRSEQNVTIAVFNGRSMSQVPFEKGMAFLTALKKVKEAQHEFVAYGTPLEWAIKKNKNIDVFVHLVHNMTPRRLPAGINCDPIVALAKYHKNKKSTHAKLILHSMGAMCRNYFDENNCVLNLHGFDDSMTAVYNAFITDKF